MSCGRPRTNTGAILLGMSYQYRDNLVVVCPPGSKVKGKKILTCLGSGDWDGKASCEGIKIAQNYLINVKKLFRL